MLCLILIHLMDLPYHGQGCGQSQEHWEYIIHGALEHCCIAGTHTCTVHLGPLRCNYSIYQYVFGRLKEYCRTWENSTRNLGEHINGT